MKMVKFICCALLFAFGLGDLIGFNRLGNNVHSHRRYRIGNHTGRTKTVEKTNWSNSPVTIRRNHRRLINYRVSMAFERPQKL